MFKNINEAINYIYTFPSRKNHRHLDCFKHVLNELDNPHQYLNVIHVAGTNGKGSTTKYMASILNAHGYQVGTLTSPFVMKFNDRICINEQMISDEALWTQLTELKPIIERAKSQDFPLTGFEIITLLAICYFKSKQVDWCVFEVGIGGRLDATNVLEKKCAIITNVGFDHMNILGNTLAEIAKEKAGIIQQDVPVISGVTEKSASYIIEEIAIEKSAPLYQLKKDIQYVINQADENQTLFEVQTPWFESHQLQTKMLGIHQIENVSLAVCAYELLVKKEDVRFNKNALLLGIASVKYELRMEQVSPHIYLDGAHNAHALERILKSCALLFSKKTLHIIFSSLLRKDIHAMLTLLEKSKHHIVVTIFDEHTIEGQQQLYEITKQYPLFTYVKDYKAYINEIEQTEDNLYLFTGSLHFVSEVRKLFT